LWEERLAEGESGGRGERKRRMTEGLRDAETK